MSDKFIEKLKEILEYPPYLIFVFVGSVFMLISLTTGNYFDRIFIFFLYLVIGSLWRYIEKDMDGGIKKYIENRKKKLNLTQDECERENKRKHSITHLIIIIIYHLGNLCLFFALLYYLRLL